MLWTSFILLVAVHTGVSQKSEGDPCTDQHTNTAGRCAPAESCQSAKDDLQSNGIKPTFCAFTFDSTLVCCRDGGNILQTNTKPSSSPVSGNDKRRVSERKCEEYSRGVVQRVEFIPLVPEPETLSLAAARCDYTGVELIVGGENANLGEFPHMAAIGWVNFEGGYSFNCGGSLISERYVLTAGHCTRDPRARRPAPELVRLGEQNLEPGVADGADPVDVPIKSIHKHPGYSPPARYHDVALLQLLADVDLGRRVRPACLWARDTTPRKGVATGWGVTDPETGETAKELQKVSLSLLSNERCDQLLMGSRNRNWWGLSSEQLCAGELRGGKDTCQGDSGSPLQVASAENQCIFHVVGVTSFGRKCAVSGQPAVYSRVSSYLQWIEGVVWPDG